MLLQAISPSPALQNIVDRYWISEWIVPPGQTYKMEGISYGSQNMVFSYGEGRLFTEINNKRITYTSANVAGQLTCKCSNYFQGHVKTFAIQFKPTGFYTLFGVPMNELTDEGRNLEDIIGKEGKEIYERLREAASTNKRVELIESFLLTRLFISRYQLKSIDKATALISTYNGVVSITHIASQLYMTKRTFERHFEEKTGLSPKLYARIIRFYNIRRALQANSMLSPYDIIYRFGYHDQSHLLKDFHYFAGQTFSAYLSTCLYIDKLFLSKIGFVTFLQGEKPRL